MICISVFMACLRLQTPVYNKPGIYNSNFNCSQFSYRMWNKSISISPWIMTLCLDLWWAKRWWLLPICDGIHFSLRIAYELLWHLHHKHSGLISQRHNSSTNSNTKHFISLIKNLTTTGNKKTENKSTNKKEYMCVSKYLYIYIYFKPRYVSVLYFPL